MRIRTILAAAAAPAALAAALLGTAAPAAHAATTGATGSVTCGSTDQNNPQVLGGTISKNLDVPAGQYCSLQWAHVTGNVSVEGVLSSSATIFDRNVGVSGPGSQLWLFNFPSHIKGNVSVTSSSGVSGGNAYGTSFGDNTGDGYQGPDSATANGSQIDGNFSFLNNTGALYVGAPLHVSGSFTASGNTQYPAHWDADGLTASGGISIS
jgi:hypothetical protein